MLKIAIGQLEVTSGHFEENFLHIKKAITEAKIQKMDLIVFPNMCISGYILGDNYLNNEVCLEIIKYHALIKALSDDIGIIFGSLSLDEFKQRSNSAYFFYNQEDVKKQSYNEMANLYTFSNKTEMHLLKENNCFLNIKINSELNSLPFVFKDQLIKIVLNDIWLNNEALMPLNTSLNNYDNIDYVINVTSSAYIKDIELERITLIKKNIITNHIKHFVYVNHVGIGLSNKAILVYDGQSGIYNEIGDCVYSCNDEFEAETSFFIENKKPYDKSNSKLLKALIFSIKAFDEQIFAKDVKWIIGLSGGLDSSIVCALLVMALKEKRICAFNMATSYNSAKTIDNAHLLANALNIELRDGNINKLVDATKEVVINEYGYDDSQVTGLTLENMQARIRGHLLSTFASINGGVITNNGNKVESALGYCTMYGDNIGAISIIGDLYKTDLFMLALEINQSFNKEVIPIRLLPFINGDTINWEMPPSAELKYQQYDPMKWFYHDELINYLLEVPRYNIDALMLGYLNDQLASNVKLGKWIKYYHLDTGEAFMKDLEWVMKQINASVFKRSQTPPLIRLTNTCFGFDINENQIKINHTTSYETLKISIINKYPC